MNRCSFFCCCRGGGKVATIELRLRITEEFRDLAHPIGVRDGIGVWQLA
jgi:hypothetical protein